MARSGPFRSAGQYQISILEEISEMNMANRVLCVFFLYRTDDLINASTGSLGILWSPCFFLLSPHGHVNLFRGHYVRVSRGKAKRNLESVLPVMTI